MSIREALEAGREFAADVGADELLAKIDAALRELDAAKPVEFTYGPLGGGYAVWRSDRRAAIGQFTCVSDETAARIAAELLNQHATPAKGEMLAAVVQGAKEEFVRVPYGASHEDVAAINDWHKIAAEALSKWENKA